MKQKTPKEALTFVERTPPRQGATMLGIPFKAHDLARIGFIGVGGRGSSLFSGLLAMEGVRITAISDPDPARIKRARSQVMEAGQPAPAVETDWKKLCRRQDVDLVYICTPWKFHAPMAIHAMKCGKDAAVEVPAAITLTECWDLVDVSEQTRCHCVMLENCCYGETELLLLNLVQKQRLGTITHGEAGYIHDLREILLADHGEGLWRREPHIRQNGNFYPTHGLGPVAWYMNIHRGDRFTRLVSMSSRSASLQEYRDIHLSAWNPKRKEKYRCGDMNTSLIQTALGRTIMLQHDVVTPRPYSRINLLQGTKGAFCDYPPRLFLDSQGHEWTSLDRKLLRHYAHPLWKKQGKLAVKMGGHGGMDFLMNYRLIWNYRRGLPPDMDVYDAACWSAPGPLSDISVALENLPLPYPDFTRDGWKKTDRKDPRPS